MKNQPDFTQEYGQRVAALPSINEPQRCADIPVQILQADPRWRLFPVEPGNRLTPAKTRIGEATADPARLQQWASELPGCTWGLATGAASGVFVLEIDTRSANSTLRVLCEDEWGWQQTLLMSAGDAGYAFFRWPVGRAMRCSGNLAPGLRIHGEGNSVLVPPSASHAYLDPEANIATAPQWLIDSAFAGVEEQSSGRILVFPKLPPQEASIATRLSGLCAKLLPFVAQACPSDPRHRVYVYMSFQFHHRRWQVQFWEKDLQTQLPRTLNLATVEEMIGVADRGGGLSNLEVRQALDLAVATRQGGVFLSLTTDQYRQLQMHCRPTSASSNAG